MKKAGIKDYEAFSKDILQTVTAKPISLEVFTDDIVDMKRQALMINSWGANVYTKIPITNSKGESCLPLIKELGPPRREAQRHRPPHARPSPRRRRGPQSRRPRRRLRVRRPYRRHRR